MITSSLLAILAVAFGLMIWKFGLKAWQGILALLFGFFLAENAVSNKIIKDIVQALIDRS